MDPAVRIRILFITIAVLGIVMAFLFQQLRLNYPHSVRGIACWQLGTALVGFAGFIYALGSLVPRLLVVLVANGCVLLGMLTWLRGSLRYLGRDLKRGPWLIGIFVSVVGMFFFTAVVPSPGARVAVFSLTAAVICLRHMFAVGSIRHGFSSNLLAISLGAVAALVTARAALAIYSETTTDAWRDGTDFDSLYVFLFGTLLVLTTTSAIVMFSERVRREFAALASRDSLTNCLNRRTILERGREEHARWLRSGEPYAVLLLDLDHFKSINDRYGHLMGDQVLTKTVEAVNQVLREYDALGRFGGEEFLVLLPRASEEALDTIAERIRTDVKAQSVADPQLHVTVSIGGAWVMREHPDFLAVVGRADAALYEAKAAGRDQVVIKS